MFGKQPFTLLSSGVAMLFLSGIVLVSCCSAYTPVPTSLPTETLAPTLAPMSHLSFTGKVCQINSGWDTNSIFLRQAEFDALGLPIGTRVTVVVLDTSEVVENVTLSLNSDLKVCSVRLAGRLRGGLGVGADTDIEPESERPDRSFNIAQALPPANNESIDFQGRVCMVKSGQDTNTVFLRQPEFDTFGVPAGTTVSITVVDTGKTAENVTLGLDSGLVTCVVRLPERLRGTLGVADDTGIDSPEERPDHQFSIRLPQPH
jgi:hypothetical protein